MRVFGLVLIGLVVVVVVAAVVVGLGVAVFVMVARGRVAGRVADVLGRVGQPRVYFGNRFLMSRGEAAFYRVLREAAGGEFVVMTKVRLADLVEVRAQGKAWANAFNRVCRKHVDFVLLDAADLRVRVVVELDDRSHALADRRERDGFVDAVLSEAGVAIVHVKAAERYEARALGQVIRARA